MSSGHKLSSQQPNDWIHAVLALVAVILFSISTPLAKRFLIAIPPLWMTTIVNTGITLGLLLILLVQLLLNRRKPTLPGTPTRSLESVDIPWLLGTSLLGGIIAPVLATSGLARIPPAYISLFSSFEGVFTVFIAWLFFREKISKALGLGVLAITAGGLTLVAGGLKDVNITSGAFLALSAYLTWSVDTNVVGKIAHKNPLQILLVKSILATLILGTCAFAIYGLPAVHWHFVALLGTIGFIGYGLSYVLFLWSIRGIGAASAGSFMSLNPFIGVTFSVLVLGDKLTPSLLLAGVLVALGIILLIQSRRMPQ